MEYITRNISELITQESINLLKVKRDNLPEERENTSDRHVVIGLRQSSDAKKPIQHRQGPLYFIFTSITCWYSC